MLKNPRVRPISFLGGLIQFHGSKYCIYVTTKFISPGLTLLLSSELISTSLDIQRQHHKMNMSETELEAPHCLPVSNGFIAYPVTQVKCFEVSHDSHLSHPTPNSSASSVSLVFKYNFKPHCLSHHLHSSLQLYPCLCPHCCPTFSPCNNQSITFKHVNQIRSLACSQLS